jgi:hypothetical protein
MKAALIIISVFLFASVITGSSVQAQYFDEKPVEPLQGTWYSSNDFIPGIEPQSINPFISGLISQVNSDSIRSTIQHMQEYGTRFLLVDNRKIIANWIADRFRSYGYTDVKLDSFLNYVNWQGGNIDTTWQYNVVCTMTGSGAPDEVYIVGGHYDSFCAGNLFELAPGANDNATAVAATLEMARIIKKNNFQPEATIRFTLFAAEELGLFGSWYNAEKAYETGEDIRMMLNMDMISNNPDSLKQVKIYRYYSVEWAGDIAADLFTRYTDLDVFYPANLAAGGSDSFPFWAYGFPVFYLEEMAFSPNWHQISDTIGNCNIEYCAEITRGCFAVLLDQQLLPYPQGVAAFSSPQDITIAWKPTQNGNVIGCNIYRSAESGANYEKINPSCVTDSFYVDVAPLKGKEYFYIVTVVNDSLEESLPSLEVRGARFAFTDTLLVVAGLKDGKTTPDSVIRFYQAILDTIPFKWLDHTPSDPLDLGTLSQHKNVLWLLNSLEFDFPDERLGFDLVNFFENGGNMMFSGFNPTRFLAQNSGYPFHFSEAWFINRYFKVDSVNRKINSLMYRSYPVADDYDTLRVDTNKAMIINYPGELYNIEVFAPANEAKVIYRFDSHYPPGSAQGTMQDKAVGIEYMGNDFKTILLSFPLYYMDTSDARKLMKYVMTEKFTHPVGITPSSLTGKSPELVNYPNPFSYETTIAFNLNQSSDVILTIYNMRGMEVSSIVNRRFEKGFHTLTYYPGDLPSGIYQAVLQTSSYVTSRKMILIR